VGDEPVIMAGFDIRAFAPDGTVPHEEIEFPELGYAEAALTSYEDFARLRAEGVISEGTRFQVSLPTPLAPLSTFVHPDARPLLERAYTSALVDEINEITSQVPAADLAIQFDLAIEFSYIETAAGRLLAIPSHAWFEPPLAGSVTRATAEIGPGPAEAAGGRRLWYGGVAEKHSAAPLATANLTTVANANAAEVTRPLNWLHLPVPIDRDDREYFAPLGELADA